MSVILQHLVKMIRDGVLSYETVLAMPDLTEEQKRIIRDVWK